MQYVITKTYDNCSINTLKVEIAKTIRYNTTFDSTASRIDLTIIDLTNNSITTQACAYDEFNTSIDTWNIEDSNVIEFIKSAYEKVVTNKTNFKNMKYVEVR